MNWDQHYSGPENVAEQSPLRILEQVVQYHSPGEALDLACGLGRHAWFLARQGWQVTAVDSSEVAISKLRDAARATGLAIDARVADLGAPASVIHPESYDLICDCLYLQRSLLPQIRDGVRIGGLVLFALPMFDDSPFLRRSSWSSRASYDPGLPIGMFSSFGKRVRVQADANWRN